MGGGPVQRRAHAPRHARIGLARRVLRPLPAAGGAGRHRARRRRRLPAGGRRRGRPDRGAHRPADPRVHGAHRRDVGGASCAAVAGALAARPSLRRRRGGPADAAGVWTRRRTGRDPPRDHRPLPHDDARNAARRVPLRARARAARDDLRRPRCGGRGPAPRRRIADARGGAVRARPGARGIPSTPPARGGVPRIGGGADGGGFRVRDHRRTGPCARRRPARAGGDRGARGRGGLGGAARPGRSGTGRRVPRRTTWARSLPSRARPARARARCWPRCLASSRRRPGG